jgi:hypothetical protein
VNDGNHDNEQLLQAAAEVDESLLEWFRSLSVLDRLRATSRNAAVLERLARAAARNR